MKQIILLFNLLLFTFASFAQKQVHFAHGLGGNEGSWGSLASEMANCPNVNVTSFFMESAYGMQKYCDEFKSQVEGYNNADAIAIGHSFGGANLRKLDTEDTNLFQGYFTVGTAHDGAPLADSYRDGKLQAWLGVGSTRESKFKNLLSIIFQLIIISNNEVPDNLNASLTKGGLFSMLEQNLPFVGDKTSARELETNGAISNLSSAKKPAIGVQCAIPIEEDEFWTMVDDTDPGQIFQILSSQSPQNIALIIEVILHQMSNTLNLLHSISWTMPLHANKIAKARTAVNSMYVWWESIEQNWNDIIGAGAGIIGYQNQGVKTWICDCMDLNGTPVPCDGSSGQEPFDVQSVEVYCEDNPKCFVYENTPQPIFGPDQLNDGVVPYDRQALPGAIKDEYIIGVTHFNEPESGATREIIKLNIDPQKAPDPIFKIPNCLH